LKGVRGLGGIEGLMKIFGELEAMGLVEFLDNRRSIRLQDDHPAVRIQKIFHSVAELEGLKNLLLPLSTKGILFGSRASGNAHSDSSFELFVVSRFADEVRRVAEGYPLDKKLELEIWSPEDADAIEEKNPRLAKKITDGVVVWGSSW
jgi:hypothetical protein